MSWNIGSIEDINEDTLSLFFLLDPKIEILVIGIGDSVVTPPISAKLNAIARKYKVNLEVLGTDAVGFFVLFIYQIDRLLTRIFFTLFRRVRRSTSSMQNSG